MLKVYKLCYKLKIAQFIMKYIFLMMHNTFDYCSIILIL